MVQKFIVQENHPKLLIFLAGWACDETPFKNYRPTGMDYLICYDYRNLDFDYSILEHYETINVVSWSMGVWAGGHLLKRFLQKIGISIAYNGTGLPIDDQRGIPVAVYEGTLQNLTPASLQKFLRRMCGHVQAYKEFMQITPRRNFDEIKEELQLIKERFYAESNTPWTYDLAILGEKDAIFPFENMKLENEKSHIICHADSPHYDAKLFQFLLEDLWKMPCDEFYSYLKKSQ